MKIMITGLGLIGGSMAMALRSAGYSVDGFDREEVLSYALERKIIDGAAKDFTRYDVAFIALPPQATISFLTESAFADGAIVSDICGVKGIIENAVYGRERNYRYVGCHPMAGKEVSGICNASATLFHGASMIVCEHARTDSNAVERVENLCRAMGFGKIVRCDSAYHDQKIAYTSQLAHIVSNAYVKSDTAEGYVGFTGGSFQDMTRIAGVDEKMWTPLYAANRAPLKEELSRLIFHLQQYEAALESGDDLALRELCREGRECKERLDRQKHKR